MKPGDRKKALADYGKAARLGGAPPQLHRSLGLLHAAAGDKEKARRAFARYLKRVPGARDRAMVRALIRKLS